MLSKEEQIKLKDYLNGRADRTSTSWVNKLFSEGESNENLKQQLFVEWEKLKDDDIQAGEHDLETVIDRIHHIIRLKELEQRRKPLKRVISFYIKVAAIILLPLIAGTVIFSIFKRNNLNYTGSTSDATIYAPMGSRVSFNLPDGTKGMLNSGSYLSYSVPFGNKRNVSLVGEAWFEVKSNPDNPFSISAGNSTVKVTGTRFNLIACPSGNYVDLVLDEGKLEFKNINSGEFITLNPSERLVVHDGDLRKSLVDPEKYHAWTDGRLVFKNDTMAEVVRRLERWYNVKISIADEELEKYSFRATFQDDSIEEVLKFLALTSPIGYKITPGSLNPDGYYRKKEILIYKIE